MQIDPFHIPNVGCYGKQQFETRRDALAMIDRLRKRGKVERCTGGISEYRCRDCGAWHIGGGRHA